MNHWVAIPANLSRGMHYIQTAPSKINKKTKMTVQYMYINTYMYNRLRELDVPKRNVWIFRLKMISSGRASMFHLIGGCTIQSNHNQTMNTYVHQTHHTHTHTHTYVHVHVWSSVHVNTQMHSDEQYYADDDHPFDLNHITVCFFQHFSHSLGFTSLLIHVINMCYQ